MKKLIGIFTFLCTIYVIDLIVTAPEAWANNHFLLSQRIGLYGIICIGAGLLIVTGGIDLSMGSVVGFSATFFAVLILDAELPMPLAALIVLAAGVLIGLVNGLLVTYLGLQAFVVTLCGLFAYRGIARWLTNDSNPRIGVKMASLNEFFGGSILSISVYLWLLLGVFLAATIFLHFTVHGRYFLAIGSNERAARYSGINVNFYKVFAYILCSFLAAVFGLMYVIHYNTAQPSSTGNSDELYAIAGAVLGGCSLRGGEGTTVGMFIGAAILSLLRNVINMLEVKDTLEPVVIGLALLFCAILDEMLRRGVGWRDVMAAIGVRWRSPTQ